MKVLVLILFRVLLMPLKIGIEAKVLKANPKIEALVGNATMPTKNHSKFDSRIFLSFFMVRRILRIYCMEHPR